MATDRTANIRDDAERWLVQEISGDFRYGYFLYRWSVGDEAFFHFTNCTLDLQGLAEAAELLHRQTMEARTDISPAPNYSEIALKKEKVPSEHSNKPPRH